MSLLRLFKKKNKELVPGTIIKCESGRFLAFYEHRSDIIASGENESDTRKNLKLMYEDVKKFEASKAKENHIEIPPTYQATKFTEKLNCV